MLRTVALFLLPPLLVFGVYHLLTWFNVFRINEAVFWKRVALTSAVCHILLASGFLVFSYIDAGGSTFGPYLFDRSSFWRLMTVLDTTAMLVVILLFSIFERAGLNPPGLIPMTVAIIYIVGTLQWFVVGGGIGALLERFFEGLKTPDPEEEEWF
jgi:hypothetical protein